MSTDRSARVTPGDAERLLDGARGRAADTARLFDLLAAASAAPAGGQVPAGEQGALAAFREARRRDALTPRRHRMLKTVLANMVAGKVAAAAATAAAMGGVSLAAATGHLPGPLQDVAHSAFGAPAAAGQDASGPGHGGGASGGGAAETSESAPAPQESDVASAPESDQVSAPASSAAAAAPHPSLTGLCTAYQAHETRQSRGHGNPNADKYLSSRAFTVLVAAAGGADGVQSYCTALIGPAPTRPAHPDSSDHPSHSAPSHPTRSDHPTPPTHTAPSHPGRSDRPTHSAPSHPSRSDQPTRPTHTAPSHPSRSDHPTRSNPSHPAPPAHGGGSSHAGGRP